MLEKFMCARRTKEILVSGDIGFWIWDRGLLGKDNLSNKSIDVCENRKIEASYIILLAPQLRRD